MPEELSMIKRFRKRFVIITMALLAAVTFVVFTAIVVMEYQRGSSEITAKLTRSTDSSAEDQFFPLSNASKEKGDSRDSGGILKTDVGTVWISSAGVYSSTVRNETDLSDEDIVLAAESVAPLILSSGEDTVSGSVEGSSLYFRASQKYDGVYKVAFIPKDELWSAFSQRALMLYGSWLLLMIAMAIITVYLSRYVARPIEKAWTDQQRFIADASHELKTPLTVILADASILKDNPDKTIAEQMTWVEGIHAEAETMQHLTEDMLTLAQADAGVDLKQVMGTVDFSSIVEGQVLQFDAVAFERGLMIEDSVEPSLKVLGDELRLENMVKTLLENACKYAPPSSSINVRLEKAKSDAVLTIHNGGDPIPAEDLPHLFDRFYRSDKARTHEGEATSFGLGLSIAKSTAELHNGTINVSSGEDGTSFIVKIPLSK